MEGRRAVTEQDILGLIDEQAVVELTQELVRIPSENPPGQEGEVARYIQRWLEDRGLQVQVIEAEPGRPNLIAGWGPDDGPVFMLNGHTDVVPPGDGWTVDPYGGELRDGRIYGRGATDMKGGLAALLHAFDAIRRSGVRLKGKLLLVINVDEEAGGKAGAGYLIENGFVKADSCLVCEPSSLKLVTAEGGLLWMELLFRGRAVHSVLAPNGINAVEKALQVLQALMPLKRELESHVGSRGKPTIFSINMVHGGVKVNQVPGQCQVSIDVRIPPGVPIGTRDVIARVEEILDQQRAADPDLDVSLSYRDPVEPFEIPADAPIIATLRQAVADVTGKPAEDWAPQRVIQNDDSDLYHWWTKGGIPGVYFGPGAIELAHNADEYVETRELILAARIFALTALRTLGWEAPDHA